MKRKLSYWLTAAVAVLLLAGVITVRPNFSICSIDNEVAPGERSQLEQASLRFVQDFLNDTPAAYAALTVEAKLSSPEESLRQIARQVHQAPPITNLRVTKVHFLRSINLGKPALAPCLEGSYQAFVTIGSAFKQAHVIVEGGGGNQDWAFTLWLMPEEGWQVESFHATPTRILGKSSDEVRDLARSEKARGHNFNAVILYTTARDLAYRGPHLQPHAVHEIAGEMAGVPLPPQLQGQAPFAWHLNGADFSVLQIRSIAFTDIDKMYLLLVQQTEPWSQNAEPERRNQALIAEFRNTFPEYSAVFGGLVAEADERGTRRAFRTIDSAPIKMQ
jgi:hypothetical protein